MKYSYVSVCFAIISVTVHGNIVYLHKQRNDTAEFPCVLEKKDITPFAFSLMRVLVQTKEVLYQNLELKPVVRNEADKHRISVNKGLAIQRATVSIADLRGRDTDLYHCVFYYEATTQFYNHTAKTRFLLYVNDAVHEPCICADHKLLVYALSAGAGLLFLCVLGLIIAYTSQKKPTQQPKAPTVPIYEEMNGVLHAKPNAADPFLSLHLAGETQADRSTYAQPQKENPYMDHREPPSAETKPFIA